MSAWCLASVLLIACGAEASPESPPVVGTGPASPAHDLRPEEIVVSRVMKRARLILTRDADRVGHLWIEPRGEIAAEVPCDRLLGAWGLWLDDVDGDGRAEAIVALRKPAKFDPNVENRLHVYSFEQGQCVPAWRGTRLAGRFDALTVETERPGTVLVRERVARARNRVARYRWTGFGYQVQDVLWEGAGAPPAALEARLQTQEDPQ